jgi:TetR/AcrR family fatty acid metabolism transcriptional regulator
MARKKQEEKYRTILEAATGVFAKEGFHNAKIEDVANTAGVAHGTVYLYFKSKEDLLVSIFRENFRELVEYVNSEIQKESNAEDKLRKLVLLQLQLTETNPDLASLMLVEFPQTGKFLSSDSIDDLVEYMDMIAGILEEGISAKIFNNSIDPKIVATVIYSGIQGIITRWVLEGMKYPLDKTADQISQMILNGIKHSDSE